MSIRPAQPQSIGGVLDTTFQLYKASVVKMIPLSLLAGDRGLPAVIYIFARGGGINPADPVAMLNMMSSWGYWLSLLAGVFGSTWMMSAAYLKVAPSAPAATSGSARRCSGADRVCSICSSC